MKLHTLVQSSYDVFFEQLDEVNIILLHPDSRYRSLLVATLINDPDITTFYYAMGPDDIDLRSFISGLTHDLANQHPTFGRHSNTLPDYMFENFNDHLDQILETFALDLSELSDDRFLLILDEYDRSDSADDVQRFIEKLPGFMPERCRLVINSRTLPRLPWVSMIAQNRAALLLDDTVIEESFYGTPNKDDGTLEVYSLGPGFVLMNNVYIDNWEGHLPRLLFFFALERPMVTRSDICRAFWPELNAEQAVNVFHVTKRRLHKALDKDVLVHEDGYYRVNPELDIYYDVLEFVKALMDGRDEENPNRFEAWQTAANLYRGPFLQGHNDGWIEERRTHYLSGYIEAMVNIAGVWEERGNLEQSLTIYQKALSEDPFNEMLHREIMRIYTKLGRRSEAAAHYQDFVATLKRKKRKPEDETKQVYEEIIA